MPASEPWIGNTEDSMTQHSHHNTWTDGNNRTSVAFADERATISGDRQLIAIFLSSIALGLTVIVGIGGQLLGLW